VAAALLLAASGPGARLGLWHWRTGFELLAWAVYLGIAAAVLALIFLLTPRIRRQGAIVLVMAFILGAASAAGPLEFRRQARSAPPINDIATDSQSPVQRAAYPDIAPLELALPAAAAFERSLAAARAMGWEIVEADAAAGRIAAVDTTFWFGFKDDVTVRVSPAAAGSRIDVRSTSRVGRGDAGTNARRIRAFLERLK
jgi:uncharacterized protein (DUF1499 family)